jgi:hypothetical protein
MALLKMYSTTDVLTGSPISGGSALVVYNTDNMNWPTLASQSGHPTWSTFRYTNSGGTNGVANVKHTIANIMTAAGASTVS